MNVVGRTIARIDEDRDDTVLIHFEGGGALRIRGSSYEEVSQHVDYVSPEEVRAMQRAAQGEREQARLRRLKDAAWRARPCEERAAIRRITMKPGFFITEEFAQAIEMDMVRDMNRWSYGDNRSRTVKGHCKTCGERWCPNAPDVPLNPPITAPQYTGGTITIPVKPES